MTHDIKGTLELIGQASGIPIVISRKLKGRMKGLELQGTLREALTTLAENNNAIWWWSGNGVRIVPRNTTVTRSIRFPSFEDLIETAKTLCLPVDAITYHSSYDAQYARVSGPAEVVSEIEKLAKSLRNSYANVTQLRYGRVVQKDLSAK